MRVLLDRKKRAFRDGDMVEVRNAQRELKRGLREAKESYGRRVERKMDNNPKELWNGLRTMTGCGAKSRGANGDKNRADDLNTFYNRFNSPPVANLTHCLPTPPPTQPLNVTAEQV